MRSILRETHRVSISISCIMLMFLGSASDSCAENSTSAIPKKYVSTVIKCEQRLKLAPDDLALRKILAGHYIKIAHSLRSDPHEAIKFLHKANLLEPGNPKVSKNLDDVIKRMGKDPRSSSDRAELARLARKEVDFFSAISEYLQALQLKPNGPMYEQLGDVYRVRDENDKAIEQYIKAQTFGDSASLEVKLGQAYQAKKDIVSAAAAYRKAESMNADDPAVRDALVAGWDESLKPSRPLTEPLHLDSATHPELDFTDLSTRMKNSWMPPKRDDFKTAKVSAKFFRTHRIADLKIVSSSGDSSFDRSAVSAIASLKKAEPGFVLPASFVDGSTLSVEFQHIIGGPKIVLVSL